MFEWDEEKNRANVAKHGVDFHDVRAAFSDSSALVLKDDRRDYGEDRFIVLCPVQGRLMYVAYTERGDAIRIISARRANDRERRLYEQRKHN